MPPPEPPLAQRRVLLIEDEPDMAAFLQLHLADLPAQVRWESDGLKGLAAAQEDGPWDALVLDLRLPGLGGMDICRRLREAGDTVSVLMLTARSTELDRVLGLELGADDYVTKPFSVLELQARIKALWRRADAARAPRSAADLDTLSRGSLRIDRLQRRAWLGPEERPLTAREFDLLWCFAAEPGRAFTRAELLDRVWGYSHDGYEHTVNTHINRLRNKLGADCIRTVWGVGYRFEEPA